MVVEAFFWRGHEEVQNLSNLTLLSGPPSSGKTSLLFQFAFNVALAHTNSNTPSVVFICNRHRLDSKPPFLSQGIDASSDVFRRIQMKYVNDDEDVKKYFAAFHLYDTLPAAVVIDDLGDFFDNKNMGDCDPDEPSLHTMTTISQHYFGDNHEKPDLCISIIENMKEDYGLFVWPCSIVLAEYVWQQRQWFSGVSVVELGAGTCLPGLVAAKVGANVTLTDDSSRSEVLDNMRRVCNLNKLDCNVLGLTWGVWDSSIFSLQPKIILGADVLYDSNAFDDLFATVTFLLQNSPGSIFVTSYHNRSGHHLIEFLMVKWGLKCMKLLDGFSFLPQHKASSLSGNIQLAELALISENNA